MSDLATDLAPRMPPPAPIAAGPFTERQEEILTGLETIILKEGFRHLTVGDLAERLRCSRRTLYELADSKDELVLLVLDRLLQRMGKRAHEQLRELDDPIERVQAFMGVAIAEIRSVSVSFAEDIENHGPARRLFNAHYEFAATVLSGVIQEGIDRGVFRPVHPYLVAQTLDAGLARLQHPRVLRSLATSEANAFEELTSIILHGITTAPDTRGDGNGRRRRSKRAET
ncbi:MAG: TetR/AcrR family transcriptional regulator [Actinobacteria bacterium]|nr:TetR/AcrR family transcriptional regulator [Actinomycetota bacterium]